jgi:hypothetical protein
MSVIFRPPFLLTGSSVATPHLDVAYHAGAEIFLDALDRGRCRRLEQRRLELDAVRAVVDPASARLDEFADRDHRGVPKNRDPVVLTARFDPQRGKAVLLVRAAERGRDPLLVQVDPPNFEFRIQAAVPGCSLSTPSRY